MKAWVTNRNGSRNSLAEIYAAGLSGKTLEKLADADAFRSAGLDRRQALWEISVRDRPVALFREHHVEDPGGKIALPGMQLSEHVIHDYATTSLSLKAHPVSFLREKLDLLDIRPAAALGALQDGERIKVAGLVLVKQRPGTAGGICFMTIEDETGTANLVVFPDLFEKHRKEVLQSRLIMVEGRLQVEGKVIHVIVARCHDFSKLLRHLTPSRNPFHNNADPADGLPAQKKIIPEPRNFR